MKKTSARAFILPTAVGLPNVGVMQKLSDSDYFVLLPPQRRGKKGKICFHNSAVKTASSRDGANSQLYLS